MLRAVSGSLLAVAVCLYMGSVSAAPPVQPASAKQQFVKPVALRGTLGDAPIQANLRTKTEFEDGIEGDYFLFGHSNRVLLAGEIEGDELFLEESENGTDVSGQWNGRLTGDTISGEWHSADGKLTKPFNIRILWAVDKAKPGDRRR